MKPLVDARDQVEVSVGWPAISATPGTINDVLAS